MTRKKARKLMREFSRRMYLKQHGNLKGFGKIDRFYNDDWRHRDYKATGGYKAGWEAMKEYREIVGM